MHLSYIHHAFVLSKVLNHYGRKQTNATRYKYAACRRRRVKMALDEDLPVHIRDIAKTDARRLRVMAGPGTGKSWALKERVKRLVGEGQDPSRIWAVTFTRNAARELADDLADPEIPGGERIRVSTLHSYCFGLLSSHEAHTGRIPRLVMATLSYKPLKFEYATLISDLVNENPGFGDMAGCSKRINKFVAGWAEMESDMLDDPVNQSLEKRLDSWLGFHKAMLMSELVPESLRLLRGGSAPDALAAFDHVIVDEYQDLNKAEQEIINLVSAGGSLAIVGDANQSIYSLPPRASERNQGFSSQVCRYTRRVACGVPEEPCPRRGDGQQSDCPQPPARHAVRLAAKTGQARWGGAHGPLEYNG